MAGKITDLTNMSGSVAIDRTVDLLEIVDLSGDTSYKASPNFILGFTGGNPVSTSDIQSLTNKILDNTNTISLKDTLFTLQDDGDTTKQAKFQLSGITTATTRTYTLPNASSTLADISTIQTFTNKTHTSPTISGGTIDNTTITVDSIAGHTSSTTGTIYGVAVTSSKISGTSLANSTVGPSQLNTGAAGAYVATSETTTSTSFADLTTTTDSVSVTVGANGLLQVSVYAWANNSGANSNGVGFALSGANTQVGVDDMSLFWVGTSTNGYGATFLITGLNSGSTTVKMKYKVSAGTGTFSRRRISAVPL